MDFIKVVKPCKLTELYQCISFDKKICKVKSSGIHVAYLESKITKGALLVLEKVSGELNILPIINGHISFLHELGYISYYGDTLKGDKHAITLKPTHVGNAVNEQFILNHIRSQEVMSHHYGHFMLDTILFYTLLESSGLSKSFSTIDNWPSAWQASLKSFLFPDNNTFFCDKMKSLDELIAAYCKPINRPTGIIKHCIYLTCHFSILRVSERVHYGAARQIGSVNEAHYAKIRRGLGHVLPVKTSQSSLVLLTRRAQATVRWANDVEVLTDLAQYFGLKLDVISPEDFDPISLLTKLSQYKFLFFSPGSALFLPILFRRKHQHFFMPSPYRRLSKNHWPEYLVDFVAYSSALELLEVENYIVESDWNSVFTVSLQTCITHLGSRLILEHSDSN